MTASGIPRPRQHLIATAKLYPGAWKVYDIYRAGRGVDLPVWPDWCYAPLAVAYEVIRGGDSAQIGLGKIGDVARLGAMAAWRVTQGIYRYDPDLYQALIDTPIAGDLPADVLYRLPEWCVYIETPGMTWMNAPLYGFWAHLEWDVDSGRTELRLLLDGKESLVPIPIHIGKWTLSEAVTKALDVSRIHATAIGVPMPEGVCAMQTATTAPLISLLLYLCADDSEIGDGSSYPANPVAKRTKRGWRMFPAEKPTNWDVGVRIGAALRKAFHATETGQGETDPEAPIQWNARISHMQTFHSSYHTAEGIHPGSRIKDVEKIYGSVEGISRSEIESREYIQFSRQPPGLTFRLNYSGLYPPNSNETKVFSPNAEILGIKTDYQSY